MTERAECPVSNEEQMICRIKKQLHSQGFPLVSITGAGPFHDLEQKLKKRIRTDGGLKFQSSSLEEKIDPRVSMKECRSIVVLAMPYYQKADPERKRADAFSGRLSLSSRGEDYHKVMLRKMEKVMKEVQWEHPELSYRCHVDTGPLIDRYLAFRSGLGSYGYNNQLIHRSYGSYIFLGYIMINQDLKRWWPNDDDPSFRPSCKGCEACLKACPTGALEEPYRLNPDKCISGILQNKGVIPEKHRTLVLDRLYGCDECQKVCPYNHGLETDIDPCFSIDPGEHVNLEKLLMYTNKEFQKALGHNSASWRGARVLKRNALIILGNSGNSNALPIIAPFLDDSREELRISAQWAKEEIEKFKLLTESFRKS